MKQARRRCALRDSCSRRRKKMKQRTREARRGAKRAVAKVMKAEAEKEQEELKNRSQDIFRKLKMMKRQSRDIGESNCIKDKDGRIHFDEAERGRIWKEYMGGIMNHENEWDGVVDAAEVEGPVPEITKLEVKEALESMKNGKAGGPSGVMKEHFISSEHGLEVLHHVANEIVGGSSMPKDWKISTLIPIHRGKVV